MSGNVRYSFGEYHVIPRIGTDISIIDHGPGGLGRRIGRAA